MLRTLAILSALAAAQAAGASVTTLNQFTGHVKVSVVAFGQASGPTVSGSFFTGVSPASATLLDAFVISGDFLGPGAGGGGVQASLNAQPLGTSFPFDQDPGLSPTAFAYQWNASGVVSGVQNYSFFAQAALGQQMANQMSGAAMVVVTQDPSFPLRTITINMGVTEIGDTSPTETASTTFNEIIPNSIGAGASTLTLFTLADDAFNSGESAAFNGQNLLLGPLDFDGNLGTNASLVNLPVTTTGGSLNNVSITTNGDLFNWHLAILDSPVPTPGGVMVFAVSALGIGLRHRRVC